MKTEKNTSLNNIIYGIRKLSLVDYPKHPAFVLFLGGCNFNCSFCHNRQIVLKESNVYSINEVMDLIKQRIGLIDAVVVTGGEPTIHKQLISLLEILRKTGLKIKLDTNGSNPNMLEQILNQSLVDYIAMDIKHDFDHYEEVTGCKVNLEQIKRSIQLIENSNIDYEFRMTINKTMHNHKSIQKVMSYIKEKNHILLQPYQYSPYQLVDHDLKEFSKEELKELEQQTNLFIKI